MTIKRFMGKYSFLSNFHPCRVQYAGWTYPSSEHAYQAAKTNDMSLRVKISKAKDPKEAKKMGNRLKLVNGWDSVKVAVMQSVLFCKFRNPDLRQLLLDTAEEELIEVNGHGDDFWGVFRGSGENQLGKLLMEVRKALRDGS